MIDSVSGFKLNSCMLNYLLQKSCNMCSTENLGERMYYFSLNFSFMSFSKIGKSLLIETTKSAKASFLALSETHQSQVSLMRWLRLQTQMQTLLARQLWLLMQSCSDGPLSASNLSGNCYKKLVYLSHRDAILRTQSQSRGTDNFHFSHTITLISKSLIYCSIYPKLCQCVCYQISSSSFSSYSRSKWRQLGCINFASYRTETALTQQSLEQRESTAKGMAGAYWLVVKEFTRREAQVSSKLSTCMLCRVDWQVSLRVYADWWMNAIILSLNSIANYSLITDLKLKSPKPNQ